MTSDVKRAWMVISLYSRANEAVARAGGIPGSLLDTQDWMRKHFLRWPKEFAFEDWSNYQPVIRKIHLVKEELLS